MMEPVGFRENLMVLRELYPGRIVLSMKETAKVLGVDYRTVQNMTLRVKNPLPAVKLTEGEKSRLGVPIVALARWLCQKE